MGISVIVPVYNVEQYIENCVNSILNQTLEVNEIILIDDGSTDKSPMICDAFSEKYSNIRVEHKLNGGLASARNFGLDIAKEKYVSFVDSDDTINSEMYEIIIKGMIKSNADIGICGRYYVYGDGTKYIRYKKNNSDLIMSSREAIIEMNSFKSIDMAAWDKVYKRTIFDDIRFPEGKLSEDYFVMYKIFDRANKLFYTPIPLYNYVQRKNSISHNVNINYDFIEAAYEQMQFIEKKYPDLKTVVHTAYASANMTVYDFHLKENVPIKQSIQKKLRDAVKENYKYIKENNNIKFRKKIQAYFFVRAIALYNILFKIYKKVDKV